MLRARAGPRFVFLSIPNFRTTGALRDAVPARHSIVCLPIDMTWVGPITPWSGEVARVRTRDRGRKGGGRRI